MEESIDNILLVEKAAKESESSIRKGITFTCHDEENIIKVWGSSFTGKEKVYLNNELVSEKQSIKMATSHNFKDKNGNNYSVELKTESLRKPLLKCIIKKNENNLKTFIARNVKAENFTVKRMVIGFAIIFTSALILSLVIRINNLSESIFIPYGVILLIFLMITFKKGRFVIEEQ